MSDHQDAGGQSLQAPSPAPDGQEVTNSSPQTTRRMRRRVHTSTVARIAFGLPWLLLSAFVMMVVAWLASFISDAVTLLVLIAYVASGAVVLLPRVETLVARVVFHVRQPTSAEQQRLDQAWGEVTEAAGVDAARYSLWVQDEDAINAFATIGRTVAVTRWALERLPPNHLAAVLAHELGHHIGGHAWSSFLVWWYSIPGRALVRGCYLLLRGAQEFMFFLAAVFGFREPLPPSFRRMVLLLEVLGILGYAAYLIHPALLMLYAIPLLDPWFTRIGEKYADRFAAELGYGPGLIEVFSGWIDEGHDIARQNAGWWARLRATHPSCADRIRALEKYLGASAG